MKSFQTVSSSQAMEGAGEWTAAWSAADANGPASVAKPRKQPLPNRLKQLFQGAFGFSMVLPIALIVVLLPAFVRLADCFKFLKPRK